MVASLPPDVIKSLLPAIEAGRAALREMRPDEIPADARRIAAYSGGRLPPPLATSLIRLLDTNEHLRSKALEQLPTPGPARSFLARDGGWWEALAAEAAARAGEAAAADAERLEADVQRLNDQLAEAKRRLTDSVAAQGEELKRARRDADEAKARLRARLREESDRPGTGSSEATELRNALDDVEAGAAEAEAINQSLRALVRRLRRERADLERRVGAADTRSNASLDPLDLARRLDHDAAVSRFRIGQPAATQEPVVPRPLTLPAGVRPDAPDAIDWLITVDQPIVLLVDGYNVSFHLQGESFSSPQSRERLNQGLAVLARRGHGTLRVSVVYDSSLAEGREGGVGPKGVTVLFAPRDRLADEEIVALVEEAALPAVVVSSDREVRELAAVAGALPLWGEALAGWMQRVS